MDDHLKITQLEQKTDPAGWRLYTLWVGLGPYQQIQ